MCMGMVVRLHTGCQIPNLWIFATMEKGKAAMKYPKENIVIRLFLKSGKKTKGFFYMNGRTPCFASLGRDVTDDVVGWEYIDSRKENK